MNKVFGKQQNDLRVQHRINKKFQHKGVNIFLPISFNMFLGAKKKRLIEMVLLSTHNICFG